MQRYLILLILGSVLLRGRTVIAEQQPSFVVIVHAENPTEELSVSEISKLFLKKGKQWRPSHEVKLVLIGILRQLCLDSARQPPGH